MLELGLFPRLLLWAVFFQTVVTIGVCSVPKATETLKRVGAIVGATALFLAVLLGATTQSFGDRSEFFIHWIGPLQGGAGSDLSFAMDGPAMFVLLSLCLVWLIWTISVRGLSLIGGSLLTAGAALAWVSGSLWVVTFGILLAAAGGAMVVGSAESDDSEIVFRLIRDKSWGLLLLLIGLGMLSATPVDLNWMRGQVAPHTHLGHVGTFFVFLGLTVLSGVFPFMGWIKEPTTPKRQEGWFLYVAFLGLAILGLVFRTTQLFSEITWLPLAGWVGQSLAALSLVISVSQQSTTSVLRSVASAFIGILVFAGLSQQQELVLAGGVGLAFAWILIGMMYERVSSRKIWSVFDGVLVGLALASVAGVPFTLVGGAYQRWMMTFQVSDPEFAATALLVSLMTLGGTRSYWGLRHLAETESPQVGAAIVPIVLGLCLLAPATWGTLSGLAIPDQPDRMFGSLIELSIKNPMRTHGESWGIVGGALLVLQLLFFGIGTWLWRQGKSPSFRWIREVFYVEPASRWILNRLTRMATQTDRWVSIWILEKTLVRPGQRVVSGLSRLSQGWDHLYDRALFKPAQRGLDLSGKMMQRVHNGDLQWYLILAIASSLLILIHFAFKS